MSKLAICVRNKRLTRGLREASSEIGNVSPSTLSRVENGKIPDMDTFLTLCDWLEIPPSEFIKNTKDKKALNTGDAIALALSTDQTLDPEIANALASLVKAAYQYLSKPVCRRCSSARTYKNGSNKKGQLWACLDCNYSFNCCREEVKKKKRFYPSSKNPL